VVTGARVAALADPGEVLVSQTVKDLVAGSGFGFTGHGEHELKGVPGTCAYTQSPKADERLYLVKASRPIAIHGVAAGPSCRSGGRSSGAQRDPSARGPFVLVGGRNAFMPECAGMSLEPGHC
jgi:hypothetical protein